jgi:hypothetical protein
MPVWTWLVVLAAIVVFSPLLRVVIALVAGGRIGRTALAKQPDAITLTPAGGPAWSSREEWSATLEALRRQGFDAGATWAVAEMPGVFVHLMAQPRQEVLAALHEHPVGGRWVTFVCRYRDGHKTSFTNMRPTGLKPRAGDTVIHQPGAGAEALYARVLAERPEAPRLPVSASGVAEMYVQGYAEEIAWRRQAGVTRAEVVKVALRPPGNNQAA